METLLVIGLIAYFVPTLVGMLRGKKNIGGIFLLNLLVGWTLIGWIIALTIACI